MQNAAQLSTVKVSLVSVVAVKIGEPGLSKYNPLLVKPEADCTTVGAALPDADAVNDPLGEVGEPV